jgi:glycosyltransferase involved in cell wall biosynthesis
MSANQVFVVRSGPDLERLHSVPPVEDLKNGKEFLVAYVGVMGRQEGLGYLLEAVDQLVHSGGRRDILFRLVGSGPEITSLKALCKELDLEEWVIFMGRVPDSDLLSVLSTADVCVNPDEYNEMNDKSTMNKIMEYMAMGKPVVQFDLKEGRVSAGDASLYAKRNDAADFARKLAYLLDHKEERTRMGEVGRKRVESVLSWTHQEPELIRAYEKMFGDLGEEG